ncbi:hypothetical protein Aduo_014157 [Ancylostoma duodenale]
MAFLTATSDSRGANNMGPCIAFHNNSKLTSIWLPGLREVIYKEDPMNVPVITLQGEALELDVNDVETFKNLSGGSLVIMDEVIVGKSENMFDPNFIFLNADSVLAVLSIALALFFVSYVAFSIKLLVMGVNLKKHETEMLKSMLEVRGVTITAKTSRSARLLFSLLERG